MKYLHMTYGVLLIIFCGGSMAKAEGVQVTGNCFINVTGPPPGSGSCNPCAFGSGGSGEVGIYVPSNPIFGMGAAGEFTLAKFGFDPVTSTYGFDFEGDVSRC